MYVVCFKFAVDREVLDVIKLIFSISANVSLRGLTPLEIEAPTEK